VYVFAPPNVSSSAPAFVKFPVPLTTPFQLTALNTVTVALAVSAPAPPKVNAPLLVASPIVTLAPRVNPLLNVRAVAESLETTTPAVFNVNNPLPRAESFPIRIVPPVTTTPPVNVFAPPSARIDVPAFVNENAPPPIAPLSVTALGAVNVVFAVNVPEPPNVNAPLFVVSPNVTDPFNEKSFAKERTPVELLETIAPLLMETDPVPNA
jgi:hypothetical protein